MPTLKDLKVTLTWSVPARCFWCQQEIRECTFEDSTVMEPEWFHMDWDPDSAIGPGWCLHEDGRLTHAEPEWVQIRVV